MCSLARCLGHDDRSLGGLPMCGPAGHHVISLWSCKNTHSSCPPSRCAVRLSEDVLSLGLDMKAEVIRALLIWQVSTLNNTCNHELSSIHHKKALVHWRQLVTLVAEVLIADSSKVALRLLSGLEVIRASTVSHMVNMHKRSRYGLIRYLFRERSFVSWPTFDHVLSFR